MFESEWCMEGGCLLTLFKDERRKQEAAPNTVVSGLWKLWLAAMK